jgi:hypothetical protein
MKNPTEYDGVRQQSEARREPRLFRFYSTLIGIGWRLVSFDKFCHLMVAYATISYLYLPETKWA